MIKSLLQIETVPGDDKMEEIIDANLPDLTSRSAVSDLEWELRKRFDL